MNIRPTLQQPNIVELMLILTSFYQLLAIAKRTDELEEIYQIQHSSFSTPATSPTSYSGYNIMLVDDEKTVLYSCNAALTHNGYWVQAFSDPQEALKYFKGSRSRFDGNFGFKNAWL